MKIKVWNFELDLAWDLVLELSEIDRFDASWGSLEKREGRSLKTLRTIATVRSVGASTRIEGAKLSNDEIDLLLNQIDISKLVNRDSQEVAGYYDVLQLIVDGHKNVRTTESDFKNMHNMLLKYSSEDEWHRGDYKKFANSVEAVYPGGKRHLIFETTEPGFRTTDAMKELLNWYHTEDQVHPLVRIAIFAYEFLSIHPFQDGNGRMSRLLTTLLLMKSGYVWIQYVSFEHEIESRKNEYYAALRSCQANRPGEEVSIWVNFFLNALKNIQDVLVEKLRIKGTQANLAPREKSIIVYIGEHPGCKSGEVARKLGIPSPTVKRILTRLVKQNLINKHGNGPGTNYSTY